LAKCKADFKYLSSSIGSISGVSQVRGSGLLIGIALQKNKSTEIAAALQARGFLVNPANPNTIRIAPALNISRKELNLFIKTFKEVMSDVC
jgi:acetylornithine aminotransferase